MDLDRCPRCGAKWQGGDFCPACKFVPIGAGLKNSKKKKKKAGKYVEPGNTRGLFTFIFLAVTGYATYKYQPWKDDWEMVRAMFGHGRHHSIVGEWEVIKTVAVNKQQGIVARDNVDSGVIKFTDKGTVKFDLNHPQSQTSASGKYLVDGIKVAMQDLRTTGDASEQIPSVINMNLAWTGKDNVIASDKTEAIYLRRHKTGNSLIRFMQMGLKKGEKPDEGKVPGQLRGAFSDLKRSMQENEDFANKS